MFESHNECGQYVVVEVKDGVVVRLLPKAQKFADCFYIEEAELQVQNNGIMILKLILSFKNSFNKFWWVLWPTKIFWQQKFSDYGCPFKCIPTLMCIITCNYFKKQLTKVLLVSMNEISHNSFSTGHISMLMHFESSSNIISKVHSSFV